MQEDDVQVPVPELLGALLDHGRLRPAPDGRRAADRSGCTASWSASRATRRSRRAALQGMIYAILPQKLRERFEQELELDMSYSLPGPRPVPRERATCSATRSGPSSA